MAGLTPHSVCLPLVCSADDQGSLKKKATSDMYVHFLGVGFLNTPPPQRLRTTSPTKARLVQNFKT